MTAESTATRQPLTAKLSKLMREQSAKAFSADLSGYTFERSKSRYPEAKTDFSIYDGEGNLTYRGRQFSNRFFFWQPVD